MITSLDQSGTEVPLFGIQPQGRKGQSPEIKYSALRPDTMQFATPQLMSTSLTCDCILAG